MSAVAVAWAQQIHTGDTYEHFILRELAEDADRFGVATLTHAELASRCATSKQTVGRKVDALCERGLLDRRKGVALNGANTACVYLVPAVFDSFGELLRDLGVDPESEVRAYADRLLSNVTPPPAVRGHPHPRSVGPTHDLDLVLDLQEEEGRSPGRRKEERRPRDLLFEAIVEATSATVSVERGSVNRLRKQVVGDMPDASEAERVAEVWARARLYLGKMPGMPLTPAALLKNWRRLPSMPTPKMTAGQLLEVMKNGGEW